MCANKIIFESSSCRAISTNIYGAYDKFPDFFRVGTFIDSTHMKL